MHLYFRSILLDQTRNSTVSNLYLDIIEDDCVQVTYYIGVIIEDGYRKHKVYGETRIDERIYKLAKRTYGRFYNLYLKKYGFPFVIEFLDVPNFTDILSHTGNTIIDTLGCLLVNSGFSIDKKGNYRGNGSHRAYQKMFEIMEDYGYPDEMYWEVIRETY